MSGFFPNGFDMNGGLGALTVSLSPHNMAVAISMSSPSLAPHSDLAPANMAVPITISAASLGLGFSLSPANLAVAVTMEQAALILPTVTPDRRRVFFSTSRLANRTIAFTPARRITRRIAYSE